MVNLFNHSWLIIPGLRGASITWSYPYAPIIWLLVLTIFQMVALAAYTLRRRSVPGATPFAFACLFGAVWAASTLLEYVAVDLETKIFWAKVQAALALPIVTAITCFFLEYAWPGRWLNRRILALLSIPCLLLLGLVLTGDPNHLLWRGFAYGGKVIPLRGPLNWTALGYAFGVLGALNLIVFAWLFLRSPQHRWPIVIMMVGQFVGRTLYVLDGAQVIHSVLPVDVLGMAFEFLMYAIALFGFRIFDPLTLARQVITTQMLEGVLVLDTRGQVAGLNPAAERIFYRFSGCHLGSSIQELLPDWAGLGRDLQTVGAGEVEISLESGSGARDYQLEATILKDWRGLAVGHLLMLRDVTDQKIAQSQLLEQQRSLAMLHEREQLARELHDSLGQTLGYAGFQVEAVTKLVQGGRSASAISQLNRLAGILREAHSDMREYILDLHSTPAPQQPFFSALQHYLKGFTNNYGIQALLSTDERLGDEPFSTDERMQVHRILQETLSNARKHGQANCVQVSFSLEDDFVRMAVQDDGVGFDPNQAIGQSHFGLQFMRERAVALGGRLQVDSTPGEGTRVVVEVPVKNDAGTRRLGGRKEE